MNGQTAIQEIEYAERLSLKDILGRATLALLITAGCLSAQTYLLGSLQTPSGIWHKIYMDDSDTLPRAASQGTAYDAYGVYHSYADRSPGYIVISKQDTRTMAGILAHEMCHAEQDDQRRAFNETECLARWHP